MKFLIVLFCILFSSCTYMTYNIMLGPTGEYNDRVMYYIENIDYHNKYDIILSYKNDSLILKTNNLFYINISE